MATCDVCGDTCAEYGHDCTRHVGGKWRCPDCVTQYMYDLEQENQALADALVENSGISKGLGMIARERARQRYVEGFTPEHDAQYTEHELPKCAAFYADPLHDHHLWPATWDRATWDKTKSHCRQRQLAIAGALIAAEIDRLATVGFIPNPEESLA